MNALRTAEETIAELIRERDDAKKKFDRLTREIHGLEEAAAVYRRLEAVTDAVTPKEIAACESHAEAMRLLALRNSGVLLVKQAVALFTESGRVGTRGSAKTVVFRVINARRDDWEKVKEGVYRLIAEAPEVTEGSGGGDDATPAE